MTCACAVGDSVMGCPDATGDATLTALASAAPQEGRSARVRDMTKRDSWAKKTCLPASAAAPLPCTLLCSAKLSPAAVRGRAHLHAAGTPPCCGCGAAVAPPRAARLDPLTAWRDDGYRAPRNCGPRASVRRLGEGAHACLRGTLGLDFPARRKGATDLSSHGGLRVAGHDIRLRSPAASRQQRQPLRTGGKSCHLAAGVSRRLKATPVRRLSRQRAAGRGAEHAECVPTRRRVRAGRRRCVTSWVWAGVSGCLPACAQTRDAPAPKRAQLF